MLGIPYRIMQHGPDGPVDKVIYLATRRHGTDGAALRKAIREFYEHEFATAKAAKRYAAADRRLAALAPDSPQWAAAQDEVDKWLDAIRHSGQAATDAAERAVETSLKMNYHGAAAGILDQLSDKDVRAIVPILETGAPAADFFDGADPAPKSTTTPPSGAAPAERSSSTDSAAGRSKAGK